MKRKRKLNAHIWPRDERDWYIEPDWCNAALFGEVRFVGAVHDPACGSGRIVRAARAAGLRATGADIERRTRLDGVRVADFLAPSGSRFMVDNVVSNIPYRLSREFCETALAIARRKVAMLMPALWLTSDARTRWLEETPLTAVYVLTPRPSMPPGHYIRAGGKPEGGRLDFAWFIWDQAARRGQEPVLRWLRRDP